jgi:hypothetical protein
VYELPLATNEEPDLNPAGSLACTGCTVVGAPAEFAAVGSSDASDHIVADVGKAVEPAPVSVTVTLTAVGPGFTNLQQ